MAQLLTLGARTFAVELEDDAPPQAVDGGLLLPPGRAAVLHGLGDALFYRHGHNSWSPCGWRRLSEAPLRIESAQRRLTADDTTWDDPSRHHSSAVAALQGADGQVLLLGALGLDVPRLTADRDTLAGWYEDAAAPWFLAYGTEEEVFAAYARHLGDRLGRGTRRAGNVWCSWYAYYENITEEQLTKDIDALRGLPFDVVQVDDGWETRVGDWEANDKFPSGMRDLAERIRGAGLRPGLWIAPFIVLPDSRTAREHPELLLREEDGRPAVAGHNWGSPYWVLDLTLPAAQEHLRGLVRRLVGEWGYTYLKLDFLQAGTTPGRHAHPAGREEVYRTGLRIIREEAGPDTYLLASGAPLLPSLGLADGLRSGPDVAPLWEHYATRDPSDALARNAVVNTVHRLWQSPLLEVDPDVVYFRSRLNLLTERQQGLLRDLADICGFRAVSDPPGWLRPEELQAMTRYLRARPEVRRTGRYHFLLDGREVDFTPVVHPDEEQRYPVA
ncbi:MULTISPECIES: glycoside hydrolase family 36 protein [Streptomyces]|jgi:alpha-galactosidase|uniref:Alpha-galactosidase n=3 Tax=Streptomyces griseoaurantiacus TaxID=68213 RepID=F3NHY8_9ACTN|nr:MULTISPECIES: glycoside hydrolase family 36 protein [Streptomyces]EGG47028.1 alpha-galactosidase [Streptomyces griseoaurantiacus M045]MBA5225471.1 alpha-galactosidase [Streptomyces griseoaurantiacus]MDX3089416.1 alpha-galactosidase [Streptomyces sp. ME12-02E]MDX3332882.1 alpha-galactosidase [Streptomyces sp. ME02-6978a]WTI25287.1 alpha-galactosidase [Streptomyces jietaisiensis]